MILLVGLGNPGKKYQNNRHNVGHMFVDFIKNVYNLPTTTYKLIKTDCFMNQSGVFVKKLTSNYNLQSTHYNLIIVHDDLDIPFGRFHIQKGIGPKLHNGLKSIEENLKSKDFWRIRIGVDNRQKTSYMAGEIYVLKNFLPKEQNLLLNEIFPKILNQLKIFLKTEFSL